MATDAVTVAGGVDPGPTLRPTRYPLLASRYSAKREAAFSAAPLLDRGRHPGGVRCQLSRAGGNRLGHERRLIGARQEILAQLVLLRGSVMPASLLRVAT